MNKYIAVILTLSLGLSCFAGCSKKLSPETLRLDSLNSSEDKNNIHILTSLTYDDSGHFGSY